MTDSNVIRLPGTENLFTANPRGAVGVFPSSEGNGSWGTVHINPRGYTIAHGSAFLSFDTANAHAKEWARELDAEYVEGGLLPRPPFQNLPQPLVPLTAEPCWVVWQWEKNGERKPTQPPYPPDVGAAGASKCAHAAGVNTLEDTVPDGWLLQARHDVTTFEEWFDAEPTF